MKTDELIRFLIEKDFINYCDDYEVIDEVVKRLEELGELKKHPMIRFNRRKGKFRPVVTNIVKE